MRTYRDSKTDRWYVDYFFHGRRIRYPAGDTKKEAEHLRSRINTEIIAGTHDPERTKRVVKGIDGASVMFETLVAGFLCEYRPRGGTVRYYEQRSKVWLRFFKGKRVAEITPGHVAEMLVARQGETSASTARKDVVSIATLLKWAKRKGYVSTNPADAESVSRPAEPFDPREVRWLSDDELTRLKTASPPWLKAVIAWASETGMDKGKIMRLRWQELDLERVRGRITGGGFAMQRDKTGKPIRQVLAEGAIQALRLAAKTRHTSGVIFLDAEGQPIQEKALDWALSKAYSEAKITGCNFRTFRHTFATRALRRGVPREVLAKMMGHSTAFITDRYMHVADDQLRAAAEALSGPERLGGSRVAVS